MTQVSGAIPLCPHKGCAFRCCDFQQMVHILLYPGEIEAAVAQGRSVAHLEILDTHFHGGVRARCRARDTATCDGGYKPLDCISYPFFPELSAGPIGQQGEAQVVTVAKGSGCPIAADEIRRHEWYVRDIWQVLVEKDAKIADWLRSLSDSTTDSLDPEAYQPVPGTSARDPAA